jgi:hypothetical protein
LHVPIFEDYAKQRNVRAIHELPLHFFVLIF